MSLEAETNADQEENNHRQDEKAGCSEKHLDVLV
jgi:hypothetical protein